MTRSNPWAPHLRQLTGEFVGTAFLLAAVVGSGIMAQSLSDDVGLQLLQNAFATAGVLVALILALGSVSGAHFNPAVTVGAAVAGRFAWKDVPAYVIAQFVGGLLATSALALIGIFGPAGAFADAQASGRAVEAEQALRGAAAIGETSPSED